MKFYRDKIIPWFGIAAFLMLGLWMIQDPAMFDHVNISGKRAVVKWVFSYVWGIPCGIISILYAIYLGYRQFKPKEPIDEETEV